MADPITLSIASISASALTEGIKFLYNQAGELLKRWREKKDKSENLIKETKDAINVALPNVFQNSEINSYVNYNVLKEFDSQLLLIWQDLSVYANDLEPVNPKDNELLAKVDALRRIIETVLQQQINFKGEQRPSSSPKVTSEMKVESVRGYLETLKIGKIKSGRAEAKTEIGTVEQGGKVTGMSIDEMG